MDSIVAYIRNGTLTEDVYEATEIRCKSPRYWLSREGKLYKRSYTGPYLLCVHPEVVDLILEELHGGICGSHTGGQTLAHRAFTPKDTGGQTCKEVHKNTPKSVIDVKGMLQIYTS